MKITNENYFYITLSVLLVLVAVITGSSMIGLTVAGIISIFAFIRRENGLLLLILFVSIRPFLIAMNPGIKILGDLIILAMLIKTIFTYRKKIKSLFQFHVFEYAFFLYLILGIASALLTGVDPKAIIIQFRAYILFYLVFYVVKRMELKETFILKAIWTTFYIAVVMSIQGIVEKISDKTLLMPEAWTNWSLSNTNHIRVYGLLKGPNEMALFLSIAFMFTFYLLYLYQGWKRVGIYSGLVLIGTTFLLTYSRGAILALIVFGIAYLIFFRSKKKLLHFVSIFALSFAMFFIVVKLSDIYYDYLYNTNDTYTESGYTDEEEATSPKKEAKSKYKEEAANRYKEAFSDDTLSMSGTDGRLYYVTKAIEVFRDYPVIGSGFGTFGGAATLAYSSPIYEDYDIAFNFYSDNQYILTLAETGTVGVLILSVFVISLLLFAIRAYKLIDDKRYAMMLTFFIITMIVGGLIYNILENDTFMLFYFLLLGIVFHKNKQVFHKTKKTA
jgi:putative inorganic carbon (hco3(-)) transporter